MTLEEDFCAETMEDSSDDLENEEVHEIVTEQEEDFCAETMEDSSDDLENEEVHEIVTEQDEEQADDECEGVQSYYYGRNRFKWSANPSKPKATRTESHNIVVQLPGLKGPAKFRNKADPDTIRNLLITEDILTIILTWTNVKLDKMRMEVTIACIAYKKCNPQKNVYVVQKLAFVNHAAQTWTWVS
ncbi:hypothetical protein QE152_g19490 [Popillia japonica]|uniref:Uncharacterized protein n=1 Tax=Popillia japonica TaxID=7064 RepID=A0AAW1KR88_POPJA